MRSRREPAPRTAADRIQVLAAGEASPVLVSVGDDMGWVLGELNLLDRMGGGGGAAVAPSGSRRRRRLSEGGSSSAKAATLSRELRNAWFDLMTLLLATFVIHAFVYFGWSRCVNRRYYRLQRQVDIEPPANKSLPEPSPPAPLPPTLTPTPT